jgi:hypothetical protein
MLFPQNTAASHTIPPRVITVDKNAAYPKAFNQLQEEGILPKSCAWRQSTYLNNLVEQDHRAHETASSSSGWAAFRSRPRGEPMLRIGNDEHVPKGADPWRRKKRRLKASDMHRRPVCSGALALNRNKEVQVNSILSYF